MPPATCPEIALWVRRRWDGGLAGLEGIHWEAALIAAMSPLIVGLEFGRDVDHRWAIHRCNGHSFLRWRYDEDR